MAYSDHVLDSIDVYRYNLIVSKTAAKSAVAIPLCTDRADVPRQYITFVHVPRATTRKPPVAIHLPCSNWSLLSFCLIVNTQIKWYLRIGTYITRCRRHLTVLPITQEFSSTVSDPQVVTVGLWPIVTLTSVPSLKVSNRQRAYVTWALATKSLCHIYQLATAAAVEYNRRQIKLFGPDTCLYCSVTAWLETSFIATAAGGLVHVGDLQRMSRVFV